MTLAVPTPPLRLKTPPARQGVIWVRQGFRVFSARPLAFTALLAAFLFGAMLLLALPIVGSMLVLMAVPLLTLVFQLATRAALDGRVPTPALFVAALRGDARRTRLLVQLGVGYAIATLFIVTFSDWVDGGAMRALEDALGSGRPDEVQAVLEQPDLQLGMLLRLSLAALLSLPFWHAPALVYWGGQGAAQALFSSLLACWRARNALVVYGLGWALLGTLFALLATVVFSLLGSREMIGIAALPAGLMFSTAFYASLYFTFVDSFESQPDTTSAIEAG
jgi:hypothetical protein